MAGTSAGRVLALVAWGLCVASVAVVVVPGIFTLAVWALGSVVEGVGSGLTTPTASGLANSRRNAAELEGMLLTGIGMTVGGSLATVVLFFVGAWQWRRGGAQTRA